MDEEDNVVDLDTYTTLNVPIDKVLDGAKEGMLEEVLVIGTGVEGLLYFASSAPNPPEILWLLEQAKQALLENT
ncbi:MAG: hypothetical protein GQ574_14685 [Crocinitomix sp.]|nr:hypothetical protein [Crocinitomix sp.]